MHSLQPRYLANRRRICRAGLCAALSAGAFQLWPRLLLAPTADLSDNPVRVGDRWTYATKDEITSQPTETFTHVVMEISDNQIVISASGEENGGSRPVIFDRCGIGEDRNLKFKPHNGRDPAGPRRRGGVAGRK